MLYDLYLCVCEGSLVSVCGLMTFTSHRSMEIEVVVEYESIVDPTLQCQQSTDAAVSCYRSKAVDAFFTFVAIDSNGKAAPIPPLVVLNITALLMSLTSHILCQSGRT